MTASCDPTRGANSSVVNRMALRSVAGSDARSADMAPTPVTSSRLQAPNARTTNTKVVRRPTRRFMTDSLFEDKTSYPSS
jgi:hypothetical protein